MLILYNFKAFQNFEMVDILVAPYESDAQLAYLNKIGLANVLITEDSDLIAFGCEKVFIMVLILLIYFS